MPLLEEFLPNLPTVWQQWYFIFIGICCPILLAYSVFIEQEHRQDLFRLLGATGLLSYAIIIDNLIFQLAMGAVILASAVEFFEILVGLHKHGKEDLKRYKAMWRSDAISKKKT